MTDYFNFLGLPSVVQELVTEEIVHNSIPEDRIQLALTSKFCNELVQRAKPKKIIDKFFIGGFSSFIANSRYCTRTKEELMKILPNCQIKQLQLYDDPDHSTEDCSEILEMLSEAARFATRFDMISTIPVHMDEIVGLYVRLKHLKSLRLKNSEFILPYYPSKVKLELGYGNAPGKFMEDLAKKSQNCPLSSFELDCNVSLDKCQRFLQTAKFSIGAEIFIWSEHAYLTYLGQNIFTLEMFFNGCVPILISQKFVGKNRRILKLKRTCCFSEIACKVISASNPKKNYFSGVLKENQQQMLINLENVVPDEILKVQYHTCRRVREFFFRPKYSASMLESAFPTANFTTQLERVKKINNVLGTNIHLFQADNFAQIIRAVKDFLKNHKRKFNTFATSHRGVKRRRI